jgi:hypothetical protein
VGLAWTRACSVWPPGAGDLRRWLRALAEGGAGDRQRRRRRGGGVLPGLGERDARVALAPGATAPTSSPADLTHRHGDRRRRRSNAGNSAVADALLRFLQERGAVLLGPVAAAPARRVDPRHRAFRADRRASCRRLIQPAPASVRVRRAVSAALAFAGGWRSPRARPIWIVPAYLACPISASI